MVPYCFSLLDGWRAIDDGSVGDHVGGDNDGYRAAGSLCEVMVETSLGTA